MPPYTSVYAKQFLEIKLFLSFQWICWTSSQNCIASQCVIPY